MFRPGLGGMQGGIHMADMTQPNVECPIHRLWRGLRGSSVVRAAQTANVIVLKLLRDQIDRRLLALRRADQPVSQKRT